MTKDLYIYCIYIYDSIHKCIFNAHTNMLQSIYKFKKKSHIKIRFVDIFVMRTQIFLVLNMCNSQMYKLSVICNFAIFSKKVVTLIYELSNVHLSQCFYFVNLPAFVCGFLRLI